jgi:hypothetical protein
MKITPCILAYVALLLPTLFVALNRFVDIADPPVVTPDTGHSFWLTGLGQCVGLGAAFILPALVVMASGFAMRRIRSMTRKDSQVVAMRCSTSRCGCHRGASWPPSLSFDRRHPPHGNRG